MSVRIITGDCVEEMAKLPAASIDAIVTDPPYHLTTGKKGGSGEASVNLESPYGRARVTTGFMGMKWDGGDVANRVETWAAALRVLKPGGHLLAFSGTRTYHRMVCSIEDAGFEIRDCIFWHYGSGFPKSHNLDNLRGESVCGCEDRPSHLAASAPLDSVRDLRDARASAAQPSGKAQGDLLQLLMPGQGQRAPSGEAQREHEGQEPGATVWAGESGVEGRRNAQAPEGELQGRPLCQDAGVGAADGEDGRLHHGAPARDGADVRLPPDADGSGRPRGPQPEQQRAGQSEAVPDERRSQTWGGWPLCAGCGKPRLPRGLGTALKPATEPIVLARRPLIGTVAANVLQHGTGALNIDGCRVEPTGESRERIGELSQDRRYTANGGTNFAATPGIRGGDPLGRWPANIILEDSEEVLAAFPQAPGQQGHIDGSEPSSKTHEVYGGFKGRMAAAPRLDTGSAARFFYTAKASAYDRNDGTYDLNSPRGNHHPTVKPTDLMRYLCRLVTPPGGTVLDPFAGSGSTLKAAELEGFNAIGIEIDPAYVEIARRRIASDFPLFAEVA